MALCVGLVVVGFGCLNKPTPEEQAVIDRTAILNDAKQQGLIMDDGESTHMKDPSILVEDTGKVTPKDPSVYASTDFKTWNAAALADVTGESSFGLIRTRAQKGAFEIAGVIGNLPELEEGASYRAWLVKRTDGLKVVDLRPVEQRELAIVNYTYTTRTDLSEFDFFVVTKQTSGETAPGAHMLEGMLRAP